MGLGTKLWIGLESDVWESVRVHGGDVLVTRKAGAWRQSRAGEFKMGKGHGGPVVSRVWDR